MDEILHEWQRHGCVMSGSTEVVRWHTNMVTGEYVGYPD